MSVLCSRGPRSLRLGLLGLVLVAAVFALPARADAHASLSASDPADGSSVAAPTSVTLTFSKPFTVPNAGIQLLDGNGTEVPTTLEIRDRTAALTPKAALAPGAYGVRWTVKATDSHPRSGSFTFGVTDASGASAAVAGTRLTAALTPGSSNPLALLGDLGRFILYTGVVLVIGALALGFFVARAGAREAQGLVLTARRSALLIGIGTLFTVLAEVALYSGPGIPWPWRFGAWVEAFASMWGLSTLCLLGSAIALVRLPGPRFAPRDTWMQTPAFVGGRGGPDETDAPDPFVAGRLDPRTGYPVFAALAVLLLGLAWNGHSQSASPLLIAWLADITHVLAAGVWAGGVILLLGLIARRRQARNPALTLDAVLRFSLVATVASIAAGATGVVLAIVELPSVGALFTSSFGRILLAKMLVVAGIAAIGAYHHFRLLPALQADPSPARAQTTWKLLRVEAVAFVVVLGLTAFLAGASY